MELADDYTMGSNKLTKAFLHLTAIKEDLMNDSMHEIEDDIDNEAYNHNNDHSNYILQTQEACILASNGPYDNQWSKNMIGNVDGDAHFVVELTHQYTMGSNKLTKAFLHLIAIWEDSIKESVHEIEDDFDNGANGDDTGHSHFILQIYGM